MIHDPLASIDAGLLILRDCARRVIDAQAKVAARPDVQASLAALGLEADKASDFTRYTIVDGQIERAWQEIDGARIAWRSKGSPAVGLLSAAGACLIAVSMVATPEALAALLAEIGRRFEAAPLEEGDRQ